MDPADACQEGARGDAAARAGSPSSAEPQPPRRSISRRIVSGLTVGVIALVLVGMCGWCVLAIRFSNLPGETLRVVVAGLFGMGWVAAFMLLPRRKRTMWWFLGAFVVVLAWWWFIPASNDRDWLPEYARMASVEVDGDRVTVRNMRNCDYRSVTDFDVHYEDRTFDLNDLETVDFVCSSWGIKDVVHTLLTFGFRDGEHIVLSIETRREKGEPDSTLRSVFKQYELIYILADECDVFRLRTNFRKENVYVFPTTATPEQARVLFRAVIDKVNDLNQNPGYYNLITQNCTTGLVPFVESIYPTEPRFSWRYLLNANTARMSYEDGHIASPLSFERTVEVCHVNQYVEDHPECEGYSQRIRPDLEKHRE